LEPCGQASNACDFLTCVKTTRLFSLPGQSLTRETPIEFEQVKEVLQVTDARIRRLGTIDTSMSYKINEAIFKFQPFQRLVIAHHSQEALSHLKKLTIPIANSLEQLIATAINLNYAEFGKFAEPSIDN